MTTNFRSPGQVAQSSESKIFVVSRRVFGQVFPNFLWPCSLPFQYFIRRECTPKIHYDKKAEENTKNLFTNKHIMILKVIFTDVDLCINASISK